MKEIELLGTLILMFIFKIILLPFYIISYLFLFVEKCANILKETINSFIKLIEGEVLK